MLVSTPMTSAAACEAAVDAVEEGRPTRSGAFVLLGRHAAVLLEGHLGATVPEVGEHDDDQLVQILLRPSTCRSTP
jgi:hypothetical protein